MTNCFARLGISPNSTEKEIRKAYRRLAIQVHPDKVPPEHVQQATIAFRELHEAYEECMEHCLRGKGGNRNQSHASKPAKKASDSGIKKAFNDICDELDRELDQWLHDSFQEGLEIVQRLWPDKERLWKEVQSKFMGYSLITKIAKHLQPVNAELSQFLIGSLEQQMAEYRNKSQQELRQRVEIFNREWWSNREGLKRWVLSGEVGPSAWMATADAMPHNPEAARAIREWKDEYMNNVYKQLGKEREESAKRIVQVFPNLDEITNILRRHGPSDRRKIYSLLPDHIRLAITSGESTTVNDRVAHSPPQPSWDAPVVNQPSPPQPSCNAPVVNPPSPQPASWNSNTFHQPSQPIQWKPLPDHIRLALSGRGSTITTVNGGAASWQQTNAFHQPLSPPIGWDPMYWDPMDCSD